MHVLITGHTGFKGAWLALLLAQRGHRVTGLALPPLPGSMFDRAEVHRVLEQDLHQDLRDADATRRALQIARPEVVVHLAAQPLVRASYEDPRSTIETNVMGTLSLLEAIAATPSVQATVIVTTDKVYRNTGTRRGYREEDPLGGHDPYSASKAMADLLAASWVDSFGGPPTAIARAGNVIGGGDISKDRLFPDLMAGFAEGRPVPVRFPGAVRPWQHVLDCLDGYLRLVQALLDGHGRGPWNFGPHPDAFKTVGQAATAAASAWGTGASWVDASGDHPHEAGLLTLDSTKAREHLGWHELLEFDQAVRWTVDWAKQVHAGSDPRLVTIDQLAAFDRLRRDGQ